MSIMSRDEARRAADREWIKDWRNHQFDSGSRDAHGWPIEMHGVVEAWEISMIREEQLEEALATVLEVAHPTI